MQQKEMSIKKRKHGETALMETDDSSSLTNQKRKKKKRQQQQAGERGWEMEKWFKTAQAENRPLPKYKW